MIMSRVVKNNRGFLQLLSDCPSKQRHFLLRTATPQQLHALLQVIYNALTENIPVSEEVRTILRSHKDALLNLFFFFVSLSLFQPFSTLLAS